MSLTSVTRRWARHQLDRQLAGGASGGQTDDSTVGRLTDYIPAEAIAIFLAYISILAGLHKIDSAAAEWLGLLEPWHGYVACGLLLVPMFVYLAKRREEKRSGVTLGAPVWPLVVGIASFGVWGMMVPGVFADPVFHLIAPGLAVVLNAFLPYFEGDQT